MSNTLIGENATGLQLLLHKLFNFSQRIDNVNTNKPDCQEKGKSKGDYSLIEYNIIVEAKGDNTTKYFTLIVLSSLSPLSNM